MIVACMAAFSVLGGVNANQFLGKIPSITSEEMNRQVELFLLGEMEKELGSEHRTFTEKRLERIKHSLTPIIAAMEKNKIGKLDLPAVSYVLRRLFLDRHAWFVKGLEPESRSFAAWNESRPTQILGKNISGKVTGMFEERLTEGFGLHEIAVLAATLEHLVHGEAMVTLKAAYASLKLSPEDVVGVEEAREIMDSYMSIFILGILSGDVNGITPEHVRTLRGNVSALYPSFNETQQFVRDVQERVMPNRDYYYFAEVMGVIEEIGDRYGRWQNAECLTLKDNLVALEDSGVGGSGRVRLADFYHAALYQGRWEFVETADYLKQLGALDDTDPQNLRVIIPNYINGPTNCVASTNYYAVCCIDECDGLLGHLEQQIGMPEALPEQISSIISELPSSTVPGKRTLEPWLLRRLDEVASHHGGRIPLHGRLFHQWMHYAYPRECSFPHIMGATKLQRGDEYTIETRKDFAASEEEMHDVVKAPDMRQLNRTYEDEELLQAETAMWTMDEELVVSRASVGNAFETSNPLPAPIRGLVFIAAVGSASLALIRTFNGKMNLHLAMGVNNKDSQKYYV